MLKNGGNLERKIIALRDTTDEGREMFIKLKDTVNETYKPYILQICQGYTNPFLVADILFFRCESLNEYL